MNNTVSIFWQFHTVLVRRSIASCMWHVHMSPNNYCYCKTADNPDSSVSTTKCGPESHSHWWATHKQQITYCIQPMVRIKAATKLCKLKCKAGLSTTLMKSHVKPNRESMCTGGNKSEAKPTGSAASYLVPLSSFSPLSLPCPSLRMQFPPISLCDLLFSLFSCLSF